MIKLQKPDAALPETLATEYSMICNLATRAKLGDKYGATGADGTGPFTLTEFTPGKTVRVSRWADYPGSITPFLQNHGKAYVDQVQWVPIIEPANRANEMESGTVNAIKNPAGQDVEPAEGQRRPDGAGVAGAGELVHEPELDDDRSSASTTSACGRRSRTRSTAKGIAKAVFFGSRRRHLRPDRAELQVVQPGVENYNQFDPNLSKKLLDRAGWVAARAGSGRRTARSSPSRTSTGPPSLRAG